MIQWLLCLSSPYMTTLRGYTTLACTWPSAWGPTISILARHAPHTLEGSCICKWSDEIGRTSCQISFRNACLICVISSLLKPETVLTRRGTSHIVAATSATRTAQHNLRLEHALIATNDGAHLKSRAAGAWMGSRALKEPAHGSGAG
jgi:hypothetical protein